MASVIMIYCLMMIIQHIYDFGNINLTQLESTGELYYIQYIKDSLNKTAISSYSSLDCSKLEPDINATENFLKNEMISRGISLIVNHNINCPSNVDFNFSLKTSNLYTFIEFRTSLT
jgi:hypothetical protein